MELAVHFTFPFCPVIGSTLWLQLQVRLLLSISGCFFVGGLSCLRVGIADR